MKVESKMKTIEASLAKQEQNAYRPLRNETINKSDMVYNLKKDILMKEKFILQWVIITFKVDDLNKH